jgi:Amt family ammonium transporter
VATAVLLYLTKFIVGMRVEEGAEVLGLDVAQHREHMGS